MDLAFCSFASSSSGNCYLICSNDTGIIMDVGISQSRILEKLNFLQMPMNQVKGILLTHEHIDHTKSIQTITRRYPVSVYASEGTVEGVKARSVYIPEDRLVTVRAGESFTIGDIKVESFSLSHDANEPISYCFECNNKKIAIVTDTGCITEEIMRAVEDADLLVLEANHEVNILMYGRYPYMVKRRILSDVGHLSNEAAGKCLCDFLKSINHRKVPKVLLAHLSKENNTPQQAMLTVKNMLEEESFFVGKDILLDVIYKDAMSNLIAV